MYSPSAASSRSISTSSLPTALDKRLQTPRRNLHALNLAAAAFLTPPPSEVSQTSTKVDETVLKSVKYDQQKQVEEYDRYESEEDNDSEIQERVLTRTLEDFTFLTKTEDVTFEFCRELPHYMLDVTFTGPESEIAMHFLPIVAHINEALRIQFNDIDGICFDTKIHQTFFGSLIFPRRIWVPICFPDLLTGNMQQSLSRALVPALERVIQKKCNKLLPDNFMIKNTKFKLRLAIPAHEHEQMLAPETIVAEEEKEGETIWNQIKEMDPTLNRKGELATSSSAATDLAHTAVIEINGYRQYMTFIKEELEVTGVFSDVLTLDGILKHMRTVWCKVPVHALNEELAFLWSDSKSLKTDLKVMIQHCLGKKVVDCQRIDGCYNYQGHTAPQRQRCLSGLRYRRLPQIIVTHADAAREAHQANYEKAWREWSKKHLELQKQLAAKQAESMRIAKLKRKQRAQQKQQQQALLVKANTTPQSVSLSASKRPRHKENDTCDA